MEQELWSVKTLINLAKNKELKNVNTKNLFWISSGKFPLLKPVATIPSVSHKTLEDYNVKISGRHEDKSSLL